MHQLLYSRCPLTVSYMYIFSQFLKKMDIIDNIELYFQIFGIIIAIISSDNNTFKAIFWYICTCISTDGIPCVQEVQGSIFTQKQLQYVHPNNFYIGIIILLGLQCPPYTNGMHGVLWLAHQACNPGVLGSNRTYATHCVLIIIINIYIALIYKKIYPKRFTACCDLYLHPGVNGYLALASWLFCAKFVACMLPKEVEMAMEGTGPTRG